MQCLDASQASIEFGGLGDGAAVSGAAVRVDGGFWGFLIEPGSSEL